MVATPTAAEAFYSRFDGRVFLDAISAPSRAASMSTAKTECDGVQKRSPRLAFGKDIERALRFAAVHPGTFDGFFDCIVAAHERYSLG